MGWNTLHVYLMNNNKVDIIEGWLVENVLGMGRCTQVHAQTS